MLIKSNFESANIGDYNIIDKKIIFDLKQEPNSNFAGHCFYFKVELNGINKPNDCTLKFTINNLKQSLYPKGWVGYKPFYSTNCQKTWQRTDTAIKDFTQPSFTISVNQFIDKFWVAWYPPFPTEMLNELKYKYQQNHEPLTIKDYLTIDCFNFGNQKYPNTTIFARTHAGESMGSFWAKGFMQHISQVEQTGRLTDISFSVIPIINPLEVSKGFHRFNKDGINISRAWNQPNPPLQIQLLIQWLLSKPNLKQVYDIHGDEVSKLDDFIIYSPTGIKKLTKQIKKMIEQKKLQNKGIVFTEFVKRKFKIDAFTYEICAHTSNPQWDYIKGQNFARKILLAGNWC